jgi:hypothetical protein
MIWKTHHDKIKKTRRHDSSIQQGWEMYPTTHPPPSVTTGSKVHCTQTRLMVYFSRLPTYSCHWNDSWLYSTSANTTLGLILEFDGKNQTRAGNDDTNMCDLPIISINMQVRMIQNIRTEHKCPLLVFKRNKTYEN